MLDSKQKELSELPKEFKRLSKALEDSQLRNLALESLIEAFDESYGTDTKSKLAEQLVREHKKKLKSYSPFTMVRYSLKNRKKVML